MGIKSLSKFLRTKCPEIFQTIHVSEYAFKKVAIDVSLYMCNYKSLYGDDWLRAFIRLVSCLRENELHCVFIYDSGAPPEKQAERQERREQRAKMEERLEVIEHALLEYKEKGEASDILYEFQEKRKIDGGINLFTGKKMLNVQGIEYAVEKMRKQMFTLSESDFENTRTLFKILDVPYINSDMEAETLCSDLCIQGKVDAVLSEDTDVLAYSCPVFLTKMNTAESSCIKIKYEDVLKGLDLSSNQFLDFCIMCGTDYNKNIFKVGPVKAYQYIKEYGSIEEVQKHTSHDISVLNHVRTRELFRGYKRCQENVKYCGEPNFNALQEFIFKNNVRINVENLRKCFVRKIVFEDEEEEIVL